MEKLKPLILFLLGLTILSASLLGRWDLWNPDEPRYAEVARQMLKTGEYVLPHLNGEIYPDKPPLFFWLIAQVSRPFGDVTGVSARMPSALAALGILLLTYFLGRGLFSSRTGFLAGLILFTALEFFWLALRANIDMTLTFWTTLALFLFYRGYGAENHGRIFFLTAYLVMGLAVLTKGPVGLLIPMITISLFLLIRKEYARFRRIDLGKGLLVVIATVALWLVPACFLGGENYTREVLFQQNLGRAVDSYSHKNPFYYYLLNFPADFFPWSLFIPSAAIWFWKQSGEEKFKSLGFPLAWFLATFVFFSLVSGKRNLYLLPLYPAAALLLAKFWDDLIALGKEQFWETHRWLMTVPFYLLFGGLSLLSLVAYLGITEKFLVGGQWPAHLEVFYPLLFLFFGAGLLGAVLTARKAKLILPFGLILGIMVGGYFFSVRDLFPFMNALKSARPFSERIVRLVSPEDKLVIFLSHPASFNYFLGRASIPLIPDFPALEQIYRGGKKVFCLIQDKYYQQLPEALKSRLVILDQSDIGHRTYFLIVNRSQPS